MEMMENLRDEHWSQKRYRKNEIKEHFNSILCDFQKYKYFYKPYSKSCLQAVIKMVWNFYCSERYQSNEGLKSEENIVMSEKQ